MGQRDCSNYKGIGKHTKLRLAEMIMFFDLNDSNVCSTIRRIELLLEKVMFFPKRDGLQSDELESLIIDATENHIERPSKDQEGRETLASWGIDFEI